MRTVFVFLLIITIISCTSNTQHRYYLSGEIEQKRVYSQKEDTSTYLLTQYYPNKQVKARGNVINNKREGTWDEWYADGSILWSGEYHNNYRKIPSSIGPTKLLLSDSLVPHKPSLLRVSVDGAHRYDFLVACTNGRICKAEDNDLYDYMITPENHGIVKIYQHIQVVHGDYPEIETRLDTLYVR